MFKDRFRNKTEVVARDGGNAVVGNRSKPGHTSVSLEQLPQQNYSQGYQPSNAQQQLAHPQHQIPHHLPPIGTQPLQQSETGHFYVPGALSNPYANLPPQYPTVQNVYEDGPQVQHQQVPTRRVPFLSGMNSPQEQEQRISPSGRMRVKPPLPDFRELDVMMAAHRRTQQPVKLGAIDHPVLGDYHQHNQTDYGKMMKEYKSHKWGGLGANDSEEKKKEREKRKKMFDYGRSVNAVNFATMDLSGEDWHNRPIERKLTEADQIAKAKRDRALQFADAYRPKPTNSPQRSVPKARTPHPISSTQTVAQLQDLEEKHRRDQEAIARIKAQLNML